MSALRTRCPRCDSVFRLRREPEEGERIPCPKCKVRFDAWAALEPEVEVVEEVEEVEEERPRQRSGKSRSSKASSSSGSGIGLLAGSIIGVALLAAAATVGTSIYFKYQRDHPPVAEAGNLPTPSPKSGLPDPANTALPPAVPPVAGPAGNPVVPAGPAGAPVPAANPAGLAGVPAPGVPVVVPAAAPAVPNPAGTPVVPVAAPAGQPPAGQPAPAPAAGQPRDLTEAKTRLQGSWETTLTEGIAATIIQDFRADGRVEITLAALGAGERKGSGTWQLTQATGGEYQLTTGAVSYIRMGQQTPPVTSQYQLTFTAADKMVIKETTRPDRKPLNFTKRR